MRSEKSRRLIFCDVDGTLVHFDHELQALGNLSEDGLTFTPAGQGPLSIRALPPSSTGLQGYISEDTLALVAQLRGAGHIFVLISGARSTTFLERLPFLPAADAYVMENGGRIFFAARGADALTAAPMVEDHAWRGQQTAAGPVQQGRLPPGERSGALWDLYRTLERDGWWCDARGYTTDFRVNVKKSEGRTEAELRLLMDSLPPTLAGSFNLGYADFYPASSGKDRAAEYIMRHFGIDASRCVSVGDDDNDLALAEKVAHTYIPGFTSVSVQEAVTANPEGFTVAAAQGILGIEELLQRMLSDFGRAAGPMASGPDLQPAQLHATGQRGVASMLIVGVLFAMACSVRLRRSTRRWSL